MTDHRTRRALRAPSALTLLALLAAPLRAGGGDAPRGAQDPQSDVGGVYAFVGTRHDDPGVEVLNVLVQVHAVAQTLGGVVFPRFADDALYSITLTDPATAAPFLRYDFRFSSVAPASGLKDPGSSLSYGKGTELGPILAVGDARQNYVQTYAVLRGGLGDPRMVEQARDLAVPPPNVGLRTTPFYNDSSTGKAVSGATNQSELDVYTSSTIHDLPDGEAVWAGTREEAFYADLAGLFDLLHPRLLTGGDGQSGGGPDSLAGATSLSYALQIPLSRLPSLPYEDLFATPSSGVGVFASVSRRGEPASGPRRRQVARMANPLLCQLLLPLRRKDAYQRSDPRDDAALADPLRAPELADLFNQTFGLGFQETGRDDLVALYLPDVLRVDTGTGPVPLPGQAGFHRLSVFGGDTTAGHPSGWPNGRRPGDDVLDLLFTVLASGPAYSTISIYGDNVSANDQLYNQVFPYLATPPSNTDP